jgi:2-polyprenyl-6-methoxyphenol hydroxylase-like FAD-dependent oxidoreductase
MRQADVAIVGGGLAGSTAAAMLGHAGVEAVLIDGHKLYPKDFRCEKLDASQVELLRKTGLLEAVARAATPDLEVWVARFGRVVERKPSVQLDILYEDLVNTIRAEIPQSVHFIPAKAASIATGSERQHLTLSTGEEISARLVVLANGLNIGLRHNLFVYREMDDPWLREMRHDGSRALFALMPRLRALTGDVEVRDVKVRPVDLYVSNGYRQAGIALVGDAFGTSCPAAGTGCNKVFTDVERLCNVHIPRWLATPGMGKEKIAEFYDDEVKISCDSFAAEKAYFLRALSVETAPARHARRWGRFLGHAGKGALRAMGERLAISGLDRAGAPARGSAG